ncbi:relaxin-3 isoform X2 [Pleurodeles waltl]|uniref:relaxin-3 isoform X2 n=1 Tax=Pleurodeles waltl TaxID=8319 RepID=UPI0037096096
MSDARYLSREGGDLSRSRTGSSSCWHEKDEELGRPYGYCPLERRAAPRRRPAKKTHGKTQGYCPLERRAAPGRRPAKKTHGKTQDLLDGLTGHDTAESEEGLSMDWNMAGFSNKELSDYGRLLTGSVRQSQGPGGVSGEGLGSLRPSERRGRDVVVGLSNTCCKWGCSKSDISSLC